MEALINLVYLVAATLFIFGLKGMSHPRTAVRGNLMSAAGMLLAVLATLISQSILNYTWIIAGLVIGSGIGAAMATRVQMTAMPQMVALLNGFGGIASVLVAGAALSDAIYLLSEPQTAANSILSSGTAMVVQFGIATAASGLIGAVTFWGSLVAYGKLEGITGDQIRKRFPVLDRFKLPAPPPSPAASTAGQRSIPGVDSLVTRLNHALTTQVYAKGVLLGICVLLGLLLVINPTNIALYWVIVILSSILGWYLVIPIGGADMPVVIALLNSYSGLAAAATGFVIGNSILIITGSLVGASGLILTSIMCKAMNRSLTNVLFGVWVPEGAAASEDEVYGGKIKSSSPEELAMMIDGARRVVIVPGYGMAVAQAQHAVRDLANLLESRGTEVEFAIHPVAGRMPGHMNVLLAEADIPYDKIKEMDEINPTFEQTDVAIVIGANDVTNPLARTDPQSPIAGMPILDVINARSVIVVKRSLSPGFAGIPNPLFAADNTLMFFADAKKGMLDLVNALKEQ